MNLNIDSNNRLLSKSSKFVKDLFDKNLPGWAQYHSIQHTMETVEGCLEIGKGSEIDDDDLEILLVAAWFHDTGFTETVEGHEEKSIEIAGSFLRRHRAAEEFVNKINECILATRLNIKPETLLEKIICDADLISLGRHDYFEKNSLLKNEIELREQVEFSNLEWLKRSLQFLDSHQYHTDYAKSKFDPGLRYNRDTVYKALTEELNRV